MTATSGGVEQRWVLLSSELRRVPAQRPSDQPLHQQSAQAVNAFKTFCRTPAAGEADARQALSAFEPGLPATVLPTNTGRAQPCAGNRGRPGRDAPPDHVASEVEGAWAASLTARQARVDQHSGVILATHDLADTRLPPPAGVHGDTGQVQADRGCRFWKDPQVFAAAR